MLDDETNKRMTNSLYEMVPVEEALSIVLAQTQTLTSETVALSEARGRILAVDAVAGEPLPPFRASIVDGYAVVARDGTGVFPVVGDVTAGKPADFTLAPGQVAYITTGAPVPEGADAVVMVEDSEEVGEPGESRRVQLSRAVAPGDGMRAVGVDVAIGQTVLAAGSKLGPAELGLLATTGLAEVTVVRQPHVAVLSTGDELVEAGDVPGPGQIRDANRPMLLAAVAQAGAVAIDLGIAADSAGDIAIQMRRGLAHADVLLSTGGVSMGELDLIKPLLEEAGEVHFGRLLMKPGKPCTFATAEVDGRRRLIFGLPGNPVSGIVTFNLLAVPALRKLAGYADPNLLRVKVALAQSLKLDPERPEYHRATVRWRDDLHDGQGGFWAESTGRQASSRLLSMRTANALLELPRGEGELAAGTVVSALVIRELQ